MADFQEFKKIKVNSTSLIISGQKSASLFQIHPHFPPGSGVHFGDSTDILKVEKIKKLQKK